MKQFILTILLLPFALEGQSQIEYLRYNDNFSSLRKDSIVRKGTDQLKFIPLGGHSNISFGGEIREQVQYYHNFNFGDQPQTSNNTNTFQLWHRAMAHVNVEIGKSSRFFAQAGIKHQYFLNSSNLFWQNL